MFADAEFSVPNTALAAVDAIVSGGTYTLDHIKTKLGDFEIKLAGEMVNPRVNPVTEPIYSDVMTFPGS